MAQKDPNRRDENWWFNSRIMPPDEAVEDLEDEGEWTDRMRGCGPRDVLVQDETGRWGTDL